MMMKKQLEVLIVKQVPTHWSVPRSQCQAVHQMNPHASDHRFLGLIVHMHQVQSHSAITLIQTALIEHKRDLVLFLKILADPIAPCTTEQLCQPLLPLVRPIKCYIYSSQGSISSELPQSSTVLKKYIWMQVRYASNMSSVNHAPFLQILAPKYSKRKHRKKKRKKIETKKQEQRAFGKTGKHVSGTRVLTPIACVMKSAEMYINCGILG
ncbi:hypothetical protein V8C34DRAFT_87841 [Trichoderma compactum]